MNAAEVRRPLEDMIGEVINGFLSLGPADQGTGVVPGLKLSTVELRLPVETRVLHGPSGPVVHADMPALRTRTAFDLPLGRITLRLAATATEGMA